MTTRPASMWRRILAGGFAALVAACSSTPTTSTGTGSALASMAIVTGDGQTAAAGSTLPVALAVVVKDASGTPVAGTTVHFAVDSGGGSLASTSVVTSSDGIASAGLWTLGPAAGVTNVVSVTVGSLTPMRFHAQALAATAATLFNASPIGTGGGTLTYTKAGDPLNGLAVTVPAASYPTSVAWTIVADSTIKATLPADVFQVGPALVVTNGQGYSDSIITLTMPMSIDTSDALVPFYYDITSRTLEPIPLVARTATSATLGTRHFSADLMAVQGNASLRSGASLRAPFGSVVIVWAEAPLASLAGTWNSGFAPGHDDWEFINYGDYISPDGDCEGMSVSAMYYYYFVGGRSGPPLYHQFDTSLPNPWDNVQGIRLVGSIQGDYSVAWSNTTDQVHRLSAQALSHGVALGDLTSTWIALTLKTTHQPVLLALYGPIGGHAVIAYAAAVDPQTGMVVSFADPNFPGTPRTMSFQDGTLTAPIQLQVNAHSSAALFSEVYAAGVTSNVALTKIQSRWAEFKARDAGADRIPEHTMEIFDSLNRVWNPLNDGDTVRTTIDVLNLRVRCAGCTVPVPGADPSDAQTMYIFSDSGRNQLAGDNPAVVLSPGAVQYVGVAMAASPYGDPVGDRGFLDSRTFTVVYAPFVISPNSPQIVAGTPFTFTANNGGLGTSATRFVWDFGDGTATQTVVGDSTVTHTYTTVAIYTISVQMLDANGRLLGRYSIRTSSLIVAWRIDQTQMTSQLPLDGIGTFPADTLAQGVVVSILENLQTAPMNNLIFAIDSADIGAVLLQQTPDALQRSNGFVNPATAFLATNSFSGADPVPSSIAWQMGPVGNGMLTGHVLFGQSDAILAIGGYAINATMTPGVMQGTITFTVNFSSGTATYAVTFHAVQLTPLPPIFRGGP